MTEPSPVESQRFLVKILHFDLSHKTETGYPPGLQDHGIPLPGKYSAMSVSDTFFFFFFFFFVFC